MGASIHIYIHLDTNCYWIECYLQFLNTYIHTYFHIYSTYMCAYSCIHVYIHTYIHVYIHTYKKYFSNFFIQYLHVCILLYVCIHTYIHTYIQKSIFLTFSCLKPFSKSESPTRAEPASSPWTSRTPCRRRTTIYTSRQWRTFDQTFPRWDGQRWYILLAPKRMHLFPSIKTTFLMYVCMYVG